MDKAVDVSAYFYGVKEDVSADYRDLAFFLGITDTRNIESRNPDATSCCMDVLQTWKRKKGDEATVEVLLQALVSAELKSAADNLIRKLGKGDYPRPTPSPNQVSVTLPETPEDETRENGSFSCTIRNWLHIYCICCSYKVWFCILYAVCLIVRPSVVVTMTIEGAIISICMGKSSSISTENSADLSSCTWFYFLFAIYLIVKPCEVVIMTIIIGDLWWLYEHIEFHHRKNSGGRSRMNFHDNSIFIIRFIITSLGVAIVVEKLVQSVLSRSV